MRAVGGPRELASGCPRGKLDYELKIRGNLQRRLRINTLVMSRKHRKQAAARYKWYVNTSSVHSRTIEDSTVLF